MNKIISAYKRLSIVLIVVAVAIFPVKVSAQASFSTAEFVSDFERGMEMFNKEKYALAIHFLDKCVNESSLSAEKRADAEYYAALSAINLFNPDGEYRMITYIGGHQDSPYINDGYLALANYFYQNKNYRKAASYYEKTNRQYLKGDVLNEYYFRYGYSLYRNNDYPKALVMFSEIKDIDTEYTSPALYYYSQIAYENEMYNTALEGFQRLQNDETFGGIVPFYLVQIMYMNKDFDSLIEMAPDLLESASDERSIELCSFIGDAYYNKGLYEEALPFLERYSQAKRLSDREDQYQLAYCYYKTGNYAKASEILLDISSKSDALSQNVWFVLGDCYLKQGDKQKAQFGFGQAAKLNFDKEIKEEALFNYAKLTYEVSSPFGEAMNAFQEYVDKYPSSPKIQEVYNYLISTYLASKNYKAAISSLEKIDNMDPKMEEAYQKVAYYRGLELFKNLEFSQAITMLNKSLEYGKYSDQYKALALYWRGEAYYRQGNYEKAKNDYSSFISTSGANKTDVYSLARYNLGSALFNMGNYSEALNQFKAFVSSSNIDPDVLADARNRIADCYYVATDYTDAIDYYDKVIAYDKVDADYAMYQKAFSLGLVNKQSEKAQVLSNLIQKYPSSSYVPNAYYERGRAYMTLEQYSRSESDFQKIISSYDNQYVPKAMVQLGLLYYNIGENQKAIDQYKKVVENYKSSEEARYALNGLKNVYVEMNDVESYFAFTKMIQGYVNDSAAEKDSLLYISGENLFIAGNYDRSIEVLSSYVDEFPNGIFKINAQYYLAESLRARNRNDEALKVYEQIADQPINQYTEYAIKNVSDISFANEDYEKALKYYTKLRSVASNSENKIAALEGELSCAYELADAEKTIEIATNIESTANAPEELLRKAVFYKAKASYSLGNMQNALTSFRKIDSEVISAEGAESKYRVAEILFKTNKIDEAEETALKFVDMQSPHQYWTGRILILLSDISASKGDMLQARVTLESIRDYYTIEDDGILDEVKSKLLEMESNN